MTTSPQTFDDLEEIALGMMGMSIADFDAMTFSQFQNAVAGYERQVERQERLSWEQSRYQIWGGLLPYMGKNITMQPTDINVFGWEKQEVNEIEIKTPEQLQAEYDSVRDFYAQLKNKKVK